MTLRTYWIDSFFSHLQQCIFSKVWHRILWSVLRRTKSHYVLENLNARHSVYLVSSAQSQEPGTVLYEQPMSAKDEEVFYDEPNRNGSLRPVPVPTPSRSQLTQFVHPNSQIRWIKNILRLEDDIVRRLQRSVMVDNRKNRSLRLTGIGATLILFEDHVSRLFSECLSFYLIFLLKRRFEWVAERRKSSLVNHSLIGSVNLLQMYSCYPLDIGACSTTK